jgi:hypothetical protein
MKIPRAFIIISTVFLLSTVALCGMFFYSIGQTCGFNQAPQPYPQGQVDPETQRTVASAITTRITYFYTSTQPLSVIQPYYQQEMAQYCQEEDMWQFSPTETCVGQQCIQARCFLKGWASPDTPIGEIDVNRNSQRFTVVLSETSSGQTVIFQEEVRSDNC